MLGELSINTTTEGRVGWVVSWRPGKESSGLNFERRRLARARGISSRGKRWRLCDSLSLAEKIPWKRGDRRPRDKLKRQKNDVKDRENGPYP